MFKCCFQFLHFYILNLYTSVSIAVCKQMFLSTDFLILFHHTYEFPVIENEIHTLNRDCGLLGCDTFSVVGDYQSFEKNILPPFSGHKSFNELL